ncbi:MAG: hypothetical protein Q4Q04_01435 [Methanocorpusculum sp.]|nr:hypothetical protein [Methanocorpusculum sp.]
MAEKYTTFRRRKRSHAGLVVVVALVIGILLIGGGVAVYSTSSSVRNAITENNVPLACYVSGNDLIVLLEDEGNINTVASIEVIMEGYTIPTGYSVKSVPQVSGQRKVVYTDLLWGIYDKIQLRFRANFHDGSVKTIWTGTVKVT